MFLLLGPVLSALLHLLLHVLLIFGGDFFYLPKREILFFSAPEVIFVCFFALPASLLVAVCAQASFYPFGRVRFSVIAVAVFVAVAIENIWPPYLYISYFETHGIGGPFYSSQGTGAPETFWSATILELWMH